MDTFFEKADWKLLIVYAPKKQSASFYVEGIGDKNDKFLFKCHLSDGKRVNFEYLNSSISNIEKLLLMQKDVNNVPIFKNYKIDPVKGDTLIGCIKECKEVDSQYFLGKTALETNTRELDWVIDQIRSVGIKVDKEDFTTPSSSCTIS